MPVRTYQLILFYLVLAMTYLFLGVILDVAFTNVEVNPDHWSQKLRFWDEVWVRFLNILFWPFFVSLLVVYMVRLCLTDPERPTWQDLCDWVLSSQRCQSILRWLTALAFLWFVGSHCPKM